MDLAELKKENKAIEAKKREKSEAAKAPETKEDKLVRYLNDFRITAEKFITTKAAADPEKKKIGIHAVYDDFNGYMARRYNISKGDVVDTVKALVEQGALYTRPVKGGVMIYTAEGAKKLRAFTEKSKTRDDDIGVAAWKG
jgi:hypothetical protein